MTTREARIPRLKSGMSGEYFKAKLLAAARTRSRMVDAFTGKIYEEFVPAEGENELSPEMTQ